MKSKIISASVLAIAALASASSFAEGYVANQAEQMTAVSTKTRAEVQAELAQAKRDGYVVNFSRNAYPEVKSAPASTKTRAEVQAAVAAPKAIIATSTLEHNYPVVQ